MRQVPAHMSTSTIRLSKGILHVYEFYRLDDKDLSQKENDIEILLEAALYMLLVIGLTPDNRQHLGVNKEGTANTVWIAF